MNKNIFFIIANTAWFHRFIIGVILFSAFLIGIETYPQLHIQYQSFFMFADLGIQGVFTVEILIRILAYGKKPWVFFTSFANIFDFLITAVFYLPFGGSYAAILRLVRIFRILRLITALPRLQIIVGALIKSTPSMGYISLLLLIQMYIFAVVGHFLFGKSDPVHFGDLGASMLTLFKVITLEGWVEILDGLQHIVFAPLYFISFILMGTMIVLNLFIGVILNGFEEVKEEIELELQKRNKPTSLRAELNQISRQMEDLQKRIDALIKEKRN